ncbi:hypothetical protein GZ77_15355 [Endozoicomonas montiporae]|uniref:Protein kinase domain-containing protein n=2 Tax=Endozoicomonas montiporae TaxID=1027273 RepID=A0A081N5F7_9GAMM|nr:protein kinase [Endozoicomonas montiporae]AMO57436.1 serine/threonine protein kinase catalytic subunit [Endozoicomonas montiporae CL-33]KEQ13680.1 hypothetical protein GZ77_15355 [Endozoicomonas montiporae]
MKTEGSPSSVPGLPVSPGSADDSHKTQDDSHFKHRKVSRGSGRESISSDKEADDSDNESLKPEKGLGSREIKRSVSTTSTVTSDYFSGNEVSSDLADSGTDDSDSDIEFAAGSDSFAADSDSEDDGIVFAGSDSETSGYESDISLGSERQHHSEEVSFTHRPSLAESELNDLLITVGKMPDHKNARKAMIVPFENGRSVAHFSSRKQGNWVERLRVVESSSSEARETLAEDAAEARLLETLDHPNIIKLKGYSAQKQGASYQLRMAMEDGGTRLDDAFEGKRSKEHLPELVNCGKQLMAGLSYLQQKKILHLDIKHGNVLVHSATGQLKITDFGMAKPFREGESVDVGGTDYYAAPEVRKGLPAGYAADVYSAGIMLMDSLIGLGILSMGTLRNKQPDGQLQLITESSAELDEPGMAMVELVQNMIKVNPQERPSAQAAHDTMSHILPSLSSP